MRPAMVGYASARRLASAAPAPEPPSQNSAAAAHPPSLSLSAGTKDGGRGRDQTTSRLWAAACWTCLRSMDSGPAPTNSKLSPTTVLGTEEMR